MGVSFGMKIDATQIERFWEEKGSNTVATQRVNGSWKRITRIVRDPIALQNGNPVHHRRTAQQRLQETVPGAPCKELLIL